MTDSPKPVVWTNRDIATLLGNVLAAAWILGGAAFFLLRFGSIVYADNPALFDIWQK